MAKYAKFVIGFVIVMLAVTSLTAAELWNWTPRGEHHGAVVQVRVGNAGGTGCLVWKSEDGKKGVILTASHVVEGGQIAKAIWSNGYQSAGLIKGGYSQADVACFEVIPPENAVVVPVVPESQPLGTMGEVCGYGGPGEQLRHFWVKATDGETDRTTWQGVVISGDSGGPIFVEVDGKKYVSGTVIGGPSASPIPGTDWQAVHPVYSSKSHYCRTLLTQCYGNQCFPQSPQQIHIRPNQSPLYPPAISITQPPPVAPKSQEIDYAKIIAGVVGELKGDAAFVAALQGPAGPPGPAGKDGRDGKAAEVNVDEIANRVRAKLVGEIHYEFIPQR